MNARKILESLKRKYGPLPLWAWAAIIGGGLAVWWRLRGGRAPAPESDAIAAPALAFGAEPDYGDTGGAVPGAEAEPGVDLGGSPFYSDNKLQQETMKLVDQIRGYTEDLELMRTTGYVGDAGDGGYVEVTDPETATPTAQQGGVRWGGRVFTTKAGLGKWLAQHYAGRGNPSIAYKEWAKNHPAAAKLLSGPVPKAPKKPAAQAPKKTSTRAPARQPAKRGTGGAGARGRTPPAAKAPAPRPRAAPPRQAPPPKRKPTPAPKAKAKPPTPPPRKPATRPRGGARAQ